MSVPDMEFYVYSKMATLAHVFQMFRIPAEWIALAKMRCCQDHFSFCPMCWFSVSFDAAPRAGIGFVEAAFAGALATAF